MNLYTHSFGFASSPAFMLFRPGSHLFITPRS